MTGPRKPRTARYKLDGIGVRSAEDLLGEVLDLFSEISQSPEVFSGPTQPACRTKKRYGSASEALKAPEIPRGGRVDHCTGCRGFHIEDHR